MTELDREIQAAIDALVHRLRNREDTDDEPFAMEFVQAMIGRGWRPTEARRIAPPKLAQPGTVPPLKPETADLREALRADMEARAARDRAAKEAGAA